MTQPEGDKAEDIMRAAIDLFVERGFHGTSVPSVAERARVGAGTIYHYFEGKEALVNAVFQRWKQAMAGEMLRDFPLQGSPRASSVPAPSGSGWRTSRWTTRRSSPSSSCTSTARTSTR